MKKVVLIIAFIFASVFSFAGKIEKGFERLALKDYFKAKEYFSDALKGDSAAAAYGLSLVYLEERSPFFNIDSARKYIVVAERVFPGLKEGVKKDYSKSGVDANAIEKQMAAICEKGYLAAVDADSLAAYLHYLEYYSGCERTNDAIKMRNMAAFRDAKFLNTSEAFKKFIESYPDAAEIKEAREDFEERLYFEQTFKKDLASYERFIVNYPESHYRREAERTIYSMKVKEKTLDEYVDFARHYPESYFASEAWREVYKLAMKDFSQASLDKFKSTYPDYPFSSELEEDFRLQNYIFLPFHKNGLWGFVNEFGDEMIPPLYEDVMYFSEGLAAVSKNKQTGYINKSNQVIIPFQFTDGEPFHNGSAVVKKDSLFGLIDRNGKYLIPPAYDELSDPAEGFCVGVKNDRAAYVAKNGKPLTGFMFEVAEDFSNGYGLASTEEHFGLVNTGGHFTIEPKFEELRFIGNGLLKAMVNDQWGILKVTGDTLVPFSYDEIGEFSENRALVAKGNKCGYVNSEGQLVIPMKFTYMPIVLTTGQFENGYAIVKQKTKSVIIDTTGNTLPLTNFEDIGKPSEDFIPVKRNLKWGYAHKDGKVIVQPKFDSVSSFEKGLAIITLKKKSGLIDTTGAFRVIPLYDEISFKANVIILKNGDKYGLMLRSGGVVLPCEYNQIDIINEKVIRAIRNNNEYTYVNVQAAKVVYP